MTATSTMSKILSLENPIQAYAWGSHTAIAELLGRPSSSQPEAELWMGAHPKAPSMVGVEGERVALHEAIARQPEALLGVDVCRSFGPRLPFLLKVLAAGQPLSIQAHPDRAQAEEGFAREEASGIPVDHRTRNYRDRNHKPEILYALTRFTALRGMRPMAEIAARLRATGLDGIFSGTSGPKQVLARFLALEGESLSAARRLVLERRKALESQSATWVERLEASYPGDRGVLAPVFFHILELEPGQALFTGPGILHAYLDGVGIELMASSDNVLRCALTHKHVDAEELLRIARFEDAPGILEARQRPGVREFETPADELKLSVIDLAPETPFLCPRPFTGVEILFCASGRGTLESERGRLTFAQGDAFLVPGSYGAYRLQGTASVFSAGVARTP